MQVLILTTLFWFGPSVEGIHAPETAATHPFAVSPPVVVDALRADIDTTESDEPSLALGGALRYNAVYRDWSPPSRDQGGTFEFDTFRLNADGAYGRVELGAEYRFYSGYHMLKTGWIGYRATEDVFVQAGVHQVPLGITPYGSNSWFFQLPYYLGMEDDHDAGVKVTWTPSETVTFNGAFYKNAEGPFTGSSRASARYSYDVVPVASGALDYGPFPISGTRANKETNQVNLRGLYTLRHGEGASTELGLSVQHGGLYNLETQQTGRHSAVVAHAHGIYGPLDIKAEAIRYAHRPPNPDGQSDDFIVFGAYDAPYKVAAEGTLLTGALAYRAPLQLGPFAAVTLYHDASLLLKAPTDWVSTQQHITGAAWEAGPLFVYTDLVVARNYPFAIPGSDFSSALAEGTDAWHVRANVNLGYYF